MTTPAPRPAHALVGDPNLGTLASEKNSVDVAFYMLQTESNRSLWLEALARDAENLAAAARAMMARQS